MKLYKTKGIIIKRTDLGETDRILTIYTSRWGKIKTFAKGVRRILSKLSGHLELFNLVNLELYQTESLDRIINAQMLESFPHLKANLIKTGLSYYAAELVDKFTLEKEKDYRIFKLLKELFETFNKKALRETSKLYFLIYSFELKLLKFLGYAPQLKRCLNCRKPVRPNLNYFSIRWGGILCFRCKNQDARSIKITPDAFKILRCFQDKDFSFISRLKLEKKLFLEIRNVIRSFVKYVLSVEPKTKDFIKRIEQLG